MEFWKLSYLRDFFSNHAAFPHKYNSTDLCLLGYLYNALGRNNKNKTKEAVVRAAGKAIKHPA